MRIFVAITLLTLVVCCAGGGGEVRAQTPSPVPTPPPENVDSTDIAVAFVKDTVRDLDIGEPFAFEVQITNITAAHYVHLTEVTLEAPAALTRTRRPRPSPPDSGDAPRERPWENDLLKGEEMGLTKGGITLVSAQMPPAENFLTAVASRPATGRDWDAVGAWFAKLSFFSADCDFVIHVFYKLDANDTIHEQVATRTVRVHSSTSAVLLGAIAGCLLSALFRFFYDLSQATTTAAGSRDGDGPVKRFLPELFGRCWHAGADLACGLVTAVVATLLCNIMQDVPNFPIKVTADSVSGGLLLGLISYRLGSWVQEFLVGSAALSKSARAAAAANVAAADPSN